LPVEEAASAPCVAKVAGTAHELFCPAPQPWLDSLGPLLDDWPPALPVQPGSIPSPLAGTRRVEGVAAAPPRPGLPRALILACWVAALGVRASADDIHVVDVLGLMHSGTNLLERLIQDNLHVITRGGLYTGWKHNIPDKTCLDDQPILPTTLVLSIARDPLAQLEHLYTETYEYL
jgi:hypothetical protein